VSLELKRAATARGVPASGEREPAGAGLADAEPAAPPRQLDAGEPELRIASLEGRVAALEAALERRSAELRRLQGLLCPVDLAQWTRHLAGLPPLPRIAHEPAFWQETLELTVADVPETLADLWSSLYPPAAP
jgi:hypothetical protein